MKKRVAVILATVALLLGLVATPAHAGWTWCLAFSSQICMAEHTNGNGARVIDWGPVGACQPLGGFWNDRISSIKNTFPSNLEAVAIFWHDAGCDSWYNVLSQGETRNLGWFDNDEFSSFCIGAEDLAPPGCGQYTRDG